MTAVFGLTAPTVAAQTGECAACDSVNELADPPPLQYAVHESQIVAVLEVFRSVNETEADGSCDWMPIPWLNVSVCGTPTESCSPGFYVVAILTDPSGDGYDMRFEVIRSGNYCNAPIPVLQNPYSEGGAEIVNGPVTVACGAKCTASVNVKVKWKSVNLSPSEDNISGTFPTQNVSVTFRCSNCSGTLPG